MPKFRYTAVDSENKKVRDVVEARDEVDLWRILRNENLVPIKYKALDAERQNYRLKANETSEFSRQLASMLGSGITAVRAIEILMDRDFKPPLKLLYQRLHKDLGQGHTMSEAMRRQGKAFQELFINMYASGEESGQLEQVASKMAVHYEKEHRLNGKIKSAMTYPMILLAITSIVVMIIFTVVLPQFFELFEGMELPGITQIVISLSAFLQSHWYLVIIGALILIALVKYILSIHSVALRYDRFKLRLIIIGPLLRIIYTARFARTLSSLYTSGVSMINALRITATIVGNKYIEGQFDEVIKDVRNGEPLSEAIGKIDGSDRKLSASILIGEESGRLDTMLENTAESFDYEAEMATGRLVQLVEPCMLVIMALVIGFIMLSVMLPIMELYQNVGSM